MLPAAPEYRKLRAQKTSRLAGFFDPAMARALKPERTTPKQLVTALHAHGAVVRTVVQGVVELGLAGDGLSAAKRTPINIVMRLADAASQAQVPPAGRILVRVTRPLCVGALHGLVHYLSLLNIVTLAKADGLGDLNHDDGLSLA